MRLASVQRDPDSPRLREYRQRPRPAGTSVVYTPGRPWPLRTAMDALEALQAELQGGEHPTRDLTSRQRECLAVWAATGSQKAAAFALGISERTLHVHVRHAYVRLGVGDRLEAMRSLGWLRPPDPPEVPDGQMTLDELIDHQHDRSWRRGRAHL